MERLIATIIIAVFACGCSPLIESRLRLIETSLDGLDRLRQSLDDRGRSVSASASAERKRLDAAFDADARRQSPLSAEWVIEARLAYSTAADAFAFQQRQRERAIDADRANLVAVEAALRQIEAIDRNQLSLESLFLGGPR